RKASYSQQIIDELKSEKYQRQLLDQQRRTQLTIDFQAKARAMRKELTSNSQTVLASSPLAMAPVVAVPSANLPTNLPAASEASLVPRIDKEQSKTSAKKEARLERLRSSSQPFAVNSPVPVKGTRIDVAAPQDGVAQQNGAAPQNGVPEPWRPTAPTTDHEAAINIAMAQMREAADVVEQRIHAKSAQAKKLAKTSLVPLNRVSPKIISIGGSTGAPTFLGGLLKELFDNNYTVLLTQHMPPVFTELLVKELIRRFGIDAVEVDKKIDLTYRRVYVAKGNTHLVVSGDKSAPTVSASDDPPINFTRPSIEPMLDSAVTVFGNEVLHIMLSGCGDDGKDAAVRLRAEGGNVIAQDRESAIAWNMPEAVLEAGVVSALLHPKKMVDWLDEQFGR
ncbi:MAG: chemotaxis protein CheB, partial [Alphaproteobacteria bacterium]|nr:chemotaxis protein CheB [Alphaproteobacteria bacterium]